MKKHKNYEYLILLLLVLMVISCSNERKQQAATLDLFDEKNYHLFEGRRVQLFIDSLVRQKGMPQRVQSFCTPMTWPPQEMSYDFDYVYPDSTFSISVVGKRTFLEWKNQDRNFNWGATEAMVEVPIYQFRQDTILDISIGKYKTIKEKYVKALRENNMYFEKTLYESWVDKVGVDSVKKMLDKGMLPNKLP